MISDKLVGLVARLVRRLQSGRLGADRKPSDDQNPESDLAEVVPDPEQVRLFQLLVRERLEAAAKRPPPRRVLISDVIFHRHFRLAWARHHLFAPALFLLIASLLTCVGPTVVGGVVGILAIVAGASLCILVVTEIFSAAGTEHRAEYIVGGDFVRQYRFEPSISGLGPLLGTVGTGLLAQIAGYSAVYGAISRADGASFTGACDCVSAIYFSTVTFATVGYGDIAPVSNAARAVVALQIFQSFALIAVVLAASISWVVGYTSAVQQQREAEHAKQLRFDEDELREASMGALGRVHDVYLDEVTRDLERRRDDSLRRTWEQSNSPRVRQWEVIEELIERLGRLEVVQQRTHRDTGGTEDRDTPENRAGTVN